MSKGKFITVIMCIVMILLTACSQSKVPSDVEEQEGISDIQYSPPLYSAYDFNTYEEIIQALTMKGTEFYNVIREKKAHLELSELYMNTLSAFETGSIKLAIPQLGGENIPFEELGEGYSNITLFSGELYGLPWIWCDYFVGDVRLSVRTSYVSVLNKESIDNAKSALEVVKIVKPDAPNPENYKKSDTYTRIYEQEMQLSDRKVKALIFEMNDDPRIYVDIYYDGMYIRFLAEKELLSEEFFKKFGIRYVS